MDHKTTVIFFFIIMSIKCIFSLCLSFSLLSEETGLWAKQKVGRLKRTLRGHLVYLYTFWKNVWLIKSSPDKID